MTPTPLNERQKQESEYTQFIPISSANQEQFNHWLKKSTVRRVNKVIDSTSYNPISGRFAVTLHYITNKPNHNHWRIELLKNGDSWIISLEDGRHIITGHNPNFGHKQSKYHRIELRCMLTYLWSCSFIITLSITKYN